MRLEDKVCLVTGGASGIGKATSLLFAREGAILVVVDRDAAGAEEVAREIRRAGGKASAVGADVSREADVRDMIAQALTDFGRLDVLVNNAGYGITGSVVETSEEQWSRLMSVNLTGVYLACKYAIPEMADRGRGVIVNVASTVAAVGIRDRAAYCASKGGVAALTRAMALDHVDQGIRVNAVAPGTINSPYLTKNVLACPEQRETVLTELRARQAMGRLGEPEEIAYGILYLACDESSFCTGSILTVDGGWTAQ